MAKCTVSIKSCSNLKNLFVLFNPTVESMNCSLFLKNLEKHFCDLTYKQNFFKHVENLSQHLSENFIGDTLSITDIALKIDMYRLSVSPGALLKLSIIVIALVQKGLSCPSLGMGLVFFDYMVSLFYYKNPV